MDKLKMHSPDLTERNIDRIGELFPTVVTESRDDEGKPIRAVDFDLLRQELSDHLVEGPQERYRVDWPGKREALFAANAPIAKTLRPLREESADFDTTQNLFIEGDNLDVLKLLQESYLGKVRLIYIDPPYNDGGDLLYEDDFAASNFEYLVKSGQADLAGNRLVANTEGNGRFHSDWLSMIYPRLKLARNLLRSDGALFISIDNGEQASLKRVLDEIFGEKNFVECITWNKRVPKNDKGVGSIHEYVLVYARDLSQLPSLTMGKEGIEPIYEFVARAKKKQLPLPDAERELRLLYRKNAYDRGITLYNSFDHEYRLWGKINMSWPNANTTGPRYEVLHPKTGLPVVIPDRGWRWKLETFEEAAGLESGEYQSVEELHDGSYLCNRVWFAPDEKQQPSSVTYLDEVEKLLLRSVISLKSDGGIEVERLFNGKSLFPYPKPTSLIATLIRSLANDDGDIIMDFFAGSATTAHAVIAQNAVDGVRRSFITVQLPEECADGSEAANAGYATISDFAKERIRRAAAAIMTSSGANGGELDVGFRVLAVDTTNFADVLRAPDALTQEQLDLYADSVKADRTDEDMLFEVLLDWGLDLTMPIAVEEIEGSQVFIVEDGALIACLNEAVNPALVRAVAKREPLRVVFRDSSFETDSDRINAEQVFAELSPATDVKAI